MKIRTSLFYETDKGRRENNEDSLYAAQINDNLHILAIADGMGGTVAGERASKIAIDTLYNTFSNIDLQYDSVFLKGLLKDAYRLIQEEISKETALDPSLSGMGTTLNAALIINGDKLIHSNIGDSRLYLLNQGDLRQLSKDHSYIQEYKDENKGAVPFEILKKYSNFITKSLDGGKDIPDIYPLEKDFIILKKDSILLFCSDGLILNQAEESQIIKSLICDNDNLVGATSSLIKNAMQRGSTDNISIVLYEYGHHKRTSPFSLFIRNLFIKFRFQSNIRSSKINKHRKKSYRIQRTIGTIIVFLLCLLLAIYISTTNNFNPLPTKEIAKVKETTITTSSNKTDIKSIKKAKNKWNPYADTPSWNKKLINAVYNNGNGTYTIIVNGQRFPKRNIDFLITPKNGFIKGSNIVSVIYDPENIKMDRIINLNDQGK